MVTASAAGFGVYAVISLVTTAIFVVGALLCGKALLNERAR